MKENKEKNTGEFQSKSATMKSPPQKKSKQTEQKQPTAKSNPIYIREFRIIMVVGLGTTFIQNTRVLPFHTNLLTR